MNKALDSLRRANQATGAANINFSFFCHRLGITLGAMIRKSIYYKLLIPRQIIDNLRDYIACPLYNHAVAGTDAKPRNFIAIV